MEGTAFISPCASKQREVEAERAIQKLSERADVLPIK